MRELSHSEIEIEIVSGAGSFKGFKKILKGRKKAFKDVFRIKYPWKNRPSLKLPIFRPGRILLPIIKS